MSDSLRPHGLQHARLPCPSPTPRAYSNSCPSSWWCHPTISSSVVPFSSCHQSLAGSFPISLLQHHSSKASILRHSAFFTVQLSHPYMTTGKMSRCFKIKYLFGYTYSLNLSPFYKALPKFHYENLLLKYCIKPDFSVQVWKYLSFRINAMVFLFY